MKQNFTFFLLILVCNLFFFSCSNLSVTKRKYRPGYHIDFSSGNGIAQSNKKEIKNLATIPSIQNRKSFIIPPQSLEIPPSHSVSFGKKQVESAKKFIRTTKSNPDPQKAKNETYVPETKSINENINIIPLGILTAALSMLLLVSQKKRARKISTWARDNKYKARTASVVAHSLLGTSALLCGIHLQDAGYSIAQNAALTFAVLYSASFILYPATQKKVIQDSYLKKKLHGINLTLSGLGLLLCLGNAMTENSPTTFSENKTTTNYFSSTVHELHRIADNIFASSSLKSIAEKKKNYAGLIILCILGLILSLGLVGAISCEISCDGNGALAVLVAALGVTLSLVLFAYALHEIHKAKVRHNTPAH